MPRVVIDNREVDVPEGSTILDAARKLGLDIPTLCFLDGYKPPTSCMVCQVKLKDGNRMVPSCATKVESGMQIESEMDEVRQIRRTGLELLLSDHIGDCTAPCQLTCPTHMDIPLMLRQVAAGRLSDAIITIKRDMALPAVLGRVCPELCERTCRRGQLDAPESICLIKRFVADVDLASQTPYLPSRRPSTGKKVAIAGAGPTGLSAAYHLLRKGHACTLFDQNSAAGGVLRREFDEEQLPRDIIDAEIAVIERLGADFRMCTGIGRDVSLSGLQKEFDAFLIAVGRLSEATTEHLGVATLQGRLQIDPKTHETSIPGVFAAGDVVQPSKFVVRSVADGTAVATCIDQYLMGDDVTGVPGSFSVRTGRLSDQEIEQLACTVGRVDRVTPSGDTAVAFDDHEARAEAARCLHCDCDKQYGCKLRYYAQLYGAKTSQYRGAPRGAAPTTSPEDSRIRLTCTGGHIVYDPGKCILCGLCIQITEKAREPLGLTFIGRGFDVRVGVPFDRSIADGLRGVGRQCAGACPTGALAFRPEVCTSAHCECD